MRMISFMSRFLLGGLYSLAFAGPVMAERMVTDLSSHVIEITAKFSGTELLIFGAIERAITQGSRGQDIVVEGIDYDIIVVVQSERNDVIVRRKEMIGPVWANKDYRTLKGVQGYYAVTTTRPLSHILSAEQRRLLGAGIDQLKIDFKEPVSEKEEKSYRDGFIRNMKARKLYSQQEGTISVLDDILFRAILSFPANMPVGNYQVDVHLVRDEEVILSEHSSLEVSKKGLERLIYNFAHDYPAYYGITAIILALFAGWLGGFVARKTN